MVIHRHLLSNIDEIDLIWLGGRISEAMEVDLERNIQRVRESIERVCARVGRDASSVCLVAVTKGHSPEMIRRSVELGLRVFGENRVQEAKVKIPLCPSGLEWHMVGHLQTNKCKDAVTLFDMIESVDSLHLAKELQKRAEQAARRIRVLLEVNVAGESTKYGFKPEEVVGALKEINSMSRLEVLGLMTVAPFTTDPEKVRPVFRKLRELKELCEDQIGAPLPHLSMGMSNDFEVAIEEGATIVRIGTAIFGPRSTLKVESSGD